MYFLFLYFLREPSAFLRSMNSNKLRFRLECFEIKPYFYRVYVYLYFIISAKIIKENKLPKAVS